MAKYMECFAAANVEHNGELVVRYHKITFPCNSLYTNGLWKFLIQRTDLLGTFAKLGKAIIGFAKSVRPSAWDNWTPIGRIFMKFDIQVLPENLSRKFKLYSNRTRIRILYMKTNIRSRNYLAQFFFCTCFRQNMYRKSEHVFNVQQLF